MSEILNRRYTRIHFNPIARITFGGVANFPCRLRNLSLSGMFVHSRFAEGVGACCQVVLSQSGPGTDLTIRAEGKIVREEKDGVAIEFTAMGYDSYMFLKLLLLFEAEDPIAISHEYSAARPFLLSHSGPSLQAGRHASQ